MELWRGILRVQCRDFPQDKSTKLDRDGSVTAHYNCNFPLFSWVEFALSLLGWAAYNSFKTVDERLIVDLWVRDFLSTSLPYCSLGVFFPSSLSLFCSVYQVSRSFEIRWGGLSEIYSQITLHYIGWMKQDCLSFNCLEPPHTRPHTSGSFQARQTSFEFVLQRFRRLHLLLFTTFSATLRCCSPSSPITLHGRCLMAMNRSLHCALGSRSFQCVVLRHPPPTFFLLSNIIVRAATTPTLPPVRCRPPHTPHTAAACPPLKRSQSPLFFLFFFFCYLVQQ